MPSIIRSLIDDLASLQVELGRALDIYRNDDGSAAQAGLDLATAVWLLLPEDVRGSRPGLVDAAADAKRTPADA